MMLHMVLAIATFIEGWINTPSEPIPEEKPEASDEDGKKEEITDDEGK